MLSLLPPSSLSKFPHFRANPTGVYTTDCNSGSTDILGGHAVALIGYQKLRHFKNAHSLYHLLSLSQMGHPQWSGLLVTRQPMEHLLG